MRSFVTTTVFCFYHYQHLPNLMKSALHVAMSCGCCYIHLFIQQTFSEPLLFSRDEEMNKKQPCPRSAQKLKAHGRCEPSLPSVGPCGTYGQCKEDSHWPELQFGGVFPYKTCRGERKAVKTQVPCMNFCTVSGK